MATSDRKKMLEEKKRGSGTVARSTVGAKFSLELIVCVVDVRPGPHIVGTDVTRITGRSSRATCCNDKQVESSLGHSKIVQNADFMPGVFNGDKVIGSSLYPILRAKKCFS